MAESESAYVRQEWFSDSRGDERRMRVRWHPEERLVVLSLWQAAHCTATFRLPVQEAAAMIRLLADSLAEACTLPAEAAGSPVPGRRWSPAALWGRLQNRRRPPMPPFTIIHGG